MILVTDNDLLFYPYIIYYFTQLFIWSIQKLEISLLQYVDYAIHMNLDEKHLLPIQMIVLNDSW